MLCRARFNLAARHYEKWCDRHRFPSRPPPFLHHGNAAWFCCWACAAAVHVFIFSAAFPFFNTVDEQIHFDLAVKYSQGHIPRSLEPISVEAIPYAVVYGSPESVGFGLFPRRTIPAAAWTQPMDNIRPTLVAKRLRGTMSSITRHRSHRCITRWRVYGGGWGRTWVFTTGFCSIGCGS